MSDRPIILLVFANDRFGDASAYLRDLPRERRGIEDALELAESHGRCQVVVETNATHETLFDQLDAHRDAIIGVHFGGHADPDGLRLEDDNGRSTLARMDGIAEALSDLPALRWVFLNGCGTAEHLDELTPAVHVPLVVTDRAIRDDVAAAFAARFYRALGRGSSIEQSFSAARSEAIARYADANAVIRPGGAVRFMRQSAQSKETAWPWLLAAPPTDPRAVDWRLGTRRHVGVVLAAAALVLAAAVLAVLALRSTDPAPVADPDAAAEGRLVDPAPVGPPDGFVRIEPGTFAMALGEQGGDGQRTVTLTRAFWVQIHETTEAEWQAAMGSVPNGRTGADRAVDHINWYEAAAYANRRSALEGLPLCYDLEGCGGGVLGGGCPPDEVFCVRQTWTCAEPVPVVGPSCLGYRLPTEAEWVWFAGGGGSKTDDAELDAHAWHKGNHDGPWTAVVGQKAPNASGLYDVLGNVSEWCDDRFAPLEAGTVVDPIGPDSGKDRVRRGGSFVSMPRQLGLAARAGGSPSVRAPGAGLRLVRTADR